MTLNERAEWERRELLRQARYDRMARRILDQQAAAEARSREVCERREREARQQLEFSI